MNDLILPPSLPSALGPAPGHVLGNVANDWEAVEVWLAVVRGKSRKEVSQTEVTYRFHLAKLRWYCEQVAGSTPSYWSAQDVQRFSDFLAELPEFAYCARAANGKGFVSQGTPGWTPFRSQPSPSSQSDIKRFLHALYRAWHDTGYIRINPMALIGAGTDRKVNVDRSISLDLYDVLIQTVKAERTKQFLERQMKVRDLFIFEALRGLGLRATEMVDATMGAFFQLLHPKTQVKYWVFHVTEGTAKGGKARKVPVPPAVWEAFVNYRAAFGLTALPEVGEQTPLLLSPRTEPVPMRTTAITRTSARRFFKAWRPIGTRQGLYKIVKGRLNQVRDALAATGEVEQAAFVSQASPHWLRHTFGKAKVAEGLGMRELAGALGHSSVNTTMIYTEQQALDLIDAYIAVDPNAVAREASILIFDESKLNRKSA